MLPISSTLIIKSSSVQMISYIPINSTVSQIINLRIHLILITKIHSTIDYNISTPLQFFFHIRIIFRKTNFSLSKDKRIIFLCGELL